MRRFVLGVSVLICLLSSCASPEPPRQRGAPPYPVYRVTPRPASPGTEHRPSARAAPSIAGLHGPWLPGSGRISPRWTYIILHHSATDRGGAARFDKNHRELNGWDELGYHFVIGNGSDTPDGHVEVGSRWHKQKHGAHCKTPDNYFNEHGIGICLVGDFTKARPTPRQLTSLERLVHFLSARCGIAPSRITTHAAITNRTVCPGPNFPMAAFRRVVAQSPTAAAYPR